MLRLLLAAILALSVGTPAVACGASGDNPKPSGGLGY